MRSVWLYTRNNAVCNLAVIFTDVAVYLTQSKYPDLVTALLLETLTFSTSIAIIKQAHTELNRQSIHSKHHHHDKLGN